MEHRIQLCWVSVEKPCLSWGAIVAFAGRPEWHSVLTLALSAVGLVFGLLGFFNIVGVLVSGIPAAAAGVASDIVLAVVAKKEKNKEATTADPVGGQD